MQSSGITPKTPAPYPWYGSGWFHYTLAAMLCAGGVYGVIAFSEEMEGKQGMRIQKEYDSAFQGKLHAAFEEAQKYNLQYGSCPPPLPSPRSAAPGPSPASP